MKELVILHVYLKHFQYSISVILHSLTFSKKISLKTVTDLDKYAFGFEKNKELFTNAVAIYSSRHNIEYLFSMQNASTFFLLTEKFYNFGF